jgi:DNA-binding NarL/FixJ family response regulator
MEHPSRPSYPPLRILLVDADDRIRESLTRLLRIGRRCVVIGGSGTAAGALDLATTLRPDVVVIDSRLPGGAGERGGPSLVAQLRALRPGVRVLVMTPTADAAGLAAEADAVVRKTYRARDLIEAVLAAGRPWLQEDA